MNANRMPARSMVVATILILLTTGSAQAGENLVKDGVLHVMNSAKPAQGRDTIELEEVWRVGGDDGEDFFGMISQARIGDDGTIYLLDTRLSEVPVYSPTGERIATLSREGDGPGEVRTPTNLLFMPDGTLGLVQIFPGKIVKVATDGTPAGVFQPGGGDPTAGGFLQLFDCTSNGDDVIVSAESINPAGAGQQDRTNFVAAFDSEGKEKVRYHESSVHWDFSNFSFDESERQRVDFRRVTAGKDGRVYVAPYRNRYVIDVYTADGQPDRVIEREYATLDRTEREYNRVKTVLESQFAQIPNAKTTVARSEPDIGGINFGPDGNLWVSTSRSGRDQPEGILFTWDVFDPDGAFIKQVSAACEGDGVNDIILWSPDGNAVQVKGFTEAVQALQSRGATGGDDDGEAEPMEIVYLRRAGV